MAGLAVRGPRRFARRKRFGMAGDATRVWPMKRVIEIERIQRGLGVLVGAQRGGQAVMASGTRAQEGLAVRVSRVMANGAVDQRRMRLMGEPGRGHGLPRSGRHMDFPFAPLHQGMVRRKVHGLAMAQRTVAVTPERGRLLLVLERREVVEIVGKRVPRRIHGVWRAVTDDAAHHEHIVAASAEESGQPLASGRPLAESVWTMQNLHD